MNSTLQRVLVLGAAYGGGFSRRMAHLLGDARPLIVPPRPISLVDEQTLAAARAKRERRQAKLQALHDLNQAVNSSGWPASEVEKWAQHYRLACWHKQTILARVRGLVRPKVYRDILAYLVDSERTHSYAITREHGGELIDEYDYLFGPFYLRERVSGGYTGDEYAGEIWIPLNAGYFFNFHYSS